MKKVVYAVSIGISETTFTSQNEAWNNFADLRKAGKNPKAYRVKLGFFKNKRTKLNWDEIWVD